MYRLRIESCENPDEGFTFDHEHLSGLIATCVTELANSDRFMSDPILEAATLLDTIVRAMKQHDAGDPPIAREFDFSSPEDAYYVVFYEDSDDDDGKPLNAMWHSSGEAGLDAAVRDIVSPGWRSVES
jgi:hypothetical protein